MSTTLNYTSDSTFHVTASSVSTEISCWGAGGSGNANGQGGSGGAYAASTITLPSGAYQLYVGQSNYDGAGNGGNTYFVSASIIRVRAAGGKSDGTVSHQATLNTGSAKSLGGVGGYVVSGDYNGSGGGAAGGGLGAGDPGHINTGAGASFEQFGHSVTGSAGGLGSIGGGGDGGEGGYYRATTNSGLIAGKPGSLPGGGGGGGYSGESNTIDTTGAGAGGYITLTF